VTDLIGRDLVTEKVYGVVSYVLGKDCFQSELLTKLLPRFVSISTRIKTT
jgi:hypothetical protein